MADVERRLDRAFSEIKNRAPEISAIIANRFGRAGSQMFERSVGILERDFSEGIDDLQGWVNWQGVR